MDINTPGRYDVLITYAAIKGWEDCKYIIDSGWEKIKSSVISTEDWYVYKTEKMGQLTIPETGLTTFRLYPENQLDHYLMYFRSIELVPESN